MSDSPVIPRRLSDLPNKGVILAKATPDIVGHGGYVLWKLPSPLTFQCAGHFKQKPTIITSDLVGAYVREHYGPHYLLSHKVFELYAEGASKAIKSAANRAAVDMEVAPHKLWFTINLRKSWEDERDEEERNRYSNYFAAERFKKMLPEVRNTRFSSCLYRPSPLHLDGLDLQRVWSGSVLFENAVLSPPSFLYLFMQTSQAVSIKNFGFTARMSYGLANEMLNYFNCSELRFKTRPTAEGHKTYQKRVREAFRSIFESESEKDSDVFTLKSYNRGNYSSFSILFHIVSYDSDFSALRNVPLHPEDTVVASFEFPIGNLWAEPTHAGPWFF